MVNVVDYIDTNLEMICTKEIKYCNRCDEKYQHKLFAVHREDRILFGQCYD